MIVLEKYRVVDDVEKIRFIDYAINLFPQVPTKSAVKKAIKRHELYHNDQPALTGTWMKRGDEIMLVDLQKFCPKAFPMSIDVLFEDDHFAIVFKPSGLIVSGNQHRTLVNALIGELKLSKQRDAYKWGKPVHRLDVATSGLVIVAKTARAHAQFGHFFEQQQVHKTYLAILQGKVKSQEINQEIQGKVSKTVLKVLRTVGSLRNDALSLVQLTPLSGRTHQLRIHCAGIGHPIVGDQLYGKQGEVMKHKGLFLCAQKLRFNHPVHNEKVQISIPIPNKFEALLKQEDRRWKRLNDLNF